jgi:hypothetical protein
MHLMRLQSGAGMTFFTSKPGSIPKSDADRRSLYAIPEGFSAFPEIGHHIQQSVMPLLTMSGNSLVAIGTGFVITSDGLMMTAAHVIEEAVKQGIPRKRPDGGFDYLLQFYALYITNKTDDDSGHYIGGVLPILKAWHSPELDIGYCRLGSPYGQNGWMPKLPVFRLSPSIPAVGENILGCGYYQMNGSVGDQTEDGKLEVDYSQNAAYTRGRIIEVYPQRRDSGMLRFPCFRTDARFDSGMSGGPILNERGGVCGVICSSLPADESSPEHISYGSLIWPAFGTPIEVERPEQGSTMTTVYDLAKEGHVAVDETFDSLQIKIQPDGSRTVAISTKSI